MSSRALRLHHRIVIPVVAVALVTTSLAAFVSQSLIRRSLEARVVSQLASAAVAVSRSDFALNQAILARVKEITGADVVTYTVAGQVLASTLIGASRTQLLATVSADRSIVSAPQDQTVVRQLTCSGVPCYVAWRRVPTSPDTVIALVEQASELHAATQAMTRIILLSAGLSLIVLVLVGQLVAARVTRPLDRLVAYPRPLGWERRKTGPRG